MKKNDVEKFNSPIQVDDTFNIGTETLPHTSKKGQQIHDNIMQNKKEFLRQFRKEKVETINE